MKVLITGGNGGIAQGIKKVLEGSFKDITILTPGKETLDVSNKDRVKEYIEENNPDILINCAGFIEPSSIKDSDIDIFERHFIINTLASYYCIKYAININPKVVIINIGSTAAFEGRENWGAYCASKAALMSLSETVTREGYECYSIHPARTLTKMRERLFANEDKETLMSPDRIGSFVLKVLGNQFKNGSHIIVKKDYFYVLPSRDCPK